MKRFPREEDRPQSVLPSLPVRIALLALRFYKTYLSFLFAGNCRFDPTCSQYAYQAIERFGVARGVWLGLKRLLRCHPLSRKFGYDPVPEASENNSPRPQTTVCEALGTFHEEAGLHQSPACPELQGITSHQSLRAIPHHNFEVQDEVHS